MANEMTSAAQVGKSFNEKWYNHRNVHPDVYDDLAGKLKDRNYIVKCKPPTIVNRAILACEYIINNVPKGSHVLDMACGIGFYTCCLTTYGYRVEGFDISETAIERSKSLAQSLGMNPEMFSAADVSCLSDMPDESFDAVLAMGLFRYLDPKTRDMCYRNIHRILKLGGKFLAVHQNILFETFALNDGTLRFWADIIESYSDAKKLLGGKSIFEALNETVKVPKREYKTHSVSKNMTVHAENPLTYNEVATRYGFELEMIRYPSTHVMPPFLEAQVDQKALEEVKRKVWADHVDDWRAMFIEFEFLAFLEKK